MTFGAVGNDPLARFSVYFLAVTTKTEAFVSICVSSEWAATAGPDAKEYIDQKAAPSPPLPSLTVLLSC